MPANQTFAWFGFALCLAACDTSTISTASSTKAPGTEGTALQALVAKTKKDLVFVEGGTFQMGDFGMVHNADKLPYYGALDTMPLHKVTLDSFSIAAYKTTYEDYDVYTEATGQKKIAQDPKRIYFKRRTAPARTHWQAARDYCQWLGKQVSTPMDLPTEAQGPSMLRHATPETKGIMLYQLTRHDWRIDGMDSRNHVTGYYGQRKRAIKTILRFAHTKRDFDNIIQHMTPTGRKGDQAKNNAHVTAFLNQSIVGSADDDEEIQNFYRHLRVALKDEPTPMYPVEANDSRIYLAQRDEPREHRMLAMIQGTELQSLA